MGRRILRDFRIMQQSSLRRRKSILGYLYILIDELEPDGHAIVYSDHNNYPKSCTCVPRNDRYLCEHIKFIQRTGSRRPPGQIIETVLVDESSMIESTVVISGDG